MLVVEHAPDEGPVRLGAALEAAGHHLRRVRTDQGEPLPTTTAGLGGLVVMGGLQHAYDDDGFPSRAAELALLGDAVDRATPTIGICLGAQLLAQAAGGRAHAGHGLEVGWLAVDLEPAATGDLLLDGLPSPLHVLQWHGDTFVPPPGAVRLAGSARYPQQAFRVGSRAWGLQMHLEVDDATVRSFAASTPDDLAQVPGGGEALLAATASRLAALAPVQDLVFGRFAALVTAHLARS